MTVRIITFMCWVIIGMMWLPDSWFVGDCTLSVCHNRWCTHADHTFGQYGWYSSAQYATTSLIGFLHQGKGFSFYQWANLIAFFGFVPGLALVNARLHSVQRFWYGAMIGSILAMLAIGEVTSNVKSLTGMGWYYYCTDWCLRLGNVTGLTYGGVCFLIFVMGIPSVLLLDLVWGLKKYWRGSTDPLPEIDV